MTDTKAAALRPAGPLALLALLRGLVARHAGFFMLLWSGGLMALAPLSLLPGTAPPTGVWDIDLSLDKVFHVIAYGGLAGIPMLALADRRWRLVCAGVVLLAGFGYEIGQAYVPGRSFGYDDLLANIAGVALGVGLGAWIRRLPGRAS